MRNVLVLAAAQALSAAGMMTLALFGGILGAELAPVPQLATLPLALIVVGMAAATFPAAALMRRYGRRTAFIGSTLLAAVMALVVGGAVILRDFWLFSTASLALGANVAFQQQHRFAAAECVPPERVSRAVSIIMLGTLVAAAIGPPLTLALKNLIPGHEYAGSFIGVAAFCVAAALVLRSYHPSAQATQHVGHAGRSLAEIARQPAYVLAVVAGITAYATMSFVMTATPISMHVHDHHPDAATAFVLQSHLLAMFAPALFSGRLIARIGTRRGMVAGLVTTAGCIVVAHAGQGVAHYWLALVLLGVGWNLLFVSATTLLTSTYAPSERFRAQGLNEFAVFGTQALASLLAGPALHSLGWRALNVVALVPLVVLTILLARVAAPAQSSADAQSRNSRA
jgi:MFS family permease